MKRRYSTWRNLKGFTLIKLLICIAIMMIMTSLLFVRYPETLKRLTLANVTYTVSLLIHEAQVRGSAVDSLDSTIGGYGVYVDLANPNKIILFGDSVDDTKISPYQIIVGDSLYQINETKTTSIFPTGYNIAKLCVGTGFPFVCNYDNNPAIQTLTISVTRPDPRFNIFVNGSETNSFSAGCIELRTPLAPAVGHLRSVQIFNSGIIRTAVTKCDNSPL